MEQFGVKGTSWNERYKKIVNFKVFMINPKLGTLVQTNCPEKKLWGLLLLLAKGYSVPCEQMIAVGLT